MSGKEERSSELSSFELKNHIFLVFVLFIYLLILVIFVVEKMGVSPGSGEEDICCW